MNQIWRKQFKVENQDGLGRPILFVEDNAMDIDLTIQALNESQVANPIVICRDGEEAVNYSRSCASAECDGFPVLVLLDLKLPKMGGLEVLKHFKMHGAWKYVPVTILTTSADSSDLRDAYSLGANSYIVKPVDFGAFTEVARTINRYWILTNRTSF